LLNASGVFRPLALASLASLLAVRFGYPLVVACKGAAALLSARREPTVPWPNETDPTDSRSVAARGADRPCRADATLGDPVDPVDGGAAWHVEAGNVQTRAGLHVLLVR
jgi:hypothetical protein